jgi:HxlR-like helix-turn-helix
MKVSPPTSLPIISKSDDGTHKQKVLYSLTEQGIALVPVLAQIGGWGSRFLPASEELSIRAKLLEKGGPRMWSAFMAELRELHLGKMRRGPKESIALKLQKAYEAVVRKSAASR